MPLYSRSPRSFFLLLLLTFQVTVADMSAAVFYWDSNGATAGSGAATGTWGTSAFWSTDPTGASSTANTTITRADDVFFSAGTSGTTGTVTISGAQVASSITFDDNVALTLSGGTSLTIGGAGTNSGIFVASGDNAANVISTGIILDSATSALSFNNAGTGLLTIGAVTGSATSGTQTITVISSDAGGITLNGVIGDGAAGGKVGLLINNTGTGATTLSGANTFTGGLLVRSGVLVGSSTTATQTFFGAASNVITLGDASTTAGAKLLMGGAANAISNPIVLGASAAGTLVVGTTNTGTNVTYNGGVTGTNNLTIANMTAAGVATNGPITFATTAINNSGTVTNANGGTGTITITGGIGSNVTGIIQNSTTSATTISTTALTVNSGGTTLTNQSGGKVLTVSGGVTGTGNLILNNNSTLAGGIALSAVSNTGTITVSGTDATTGTSTVSGVISNVTGLNITSGVLSLTGQSSTFTGNITVDGSASVLAITGNSAGTYTTSSPLGNAAAGGTNFKTVTLSNGGTFRLASQNYNVNVINSTNVGAGVVFNIGTGGGTLDIASGSTLTIDDGSTTGTATTAYEMQGSGALTKSGLGILVLRQQNSFSGTINVTAGTLKASGTSIANSTAGITIQSGAVLEFNGQAVADTKPITINGTGLASAPVGVLTNSSTTSASSAGPITLGSNASIGVTTSGSLTLSGGIQAASSPYVLTISSTGTGSITLSGNSSSYTGGITVRQGILNGSTSSNALGANANIVTLGDASTVNSFNATLRGDGRTFANPIVLADRSQVTGVLSIGGTSTTAATFSGGVTGNNDLVLNSTSSNLVTLSNSVNNTGTITNLSAGSTSSISAIIGSNVTSIIENSSSSSLSLSGANTSYTGSIIITKGTLNANNNNALGAATTVVQLGDTTASNSNAATLNNSSNSTITIVNPVNVNAGSSGVLTVGNTSGVSIYSGAIALANNVTFTNSNGTAANSLTISGGVTGTGNVTLNSGTSATAALNITTTTINNVGTITNSGVGNGASTISAGIGANVTGVVQNSATSRLVIAGDNVTAGFVGTYTDTVGILEFTQPNQISYLTTPGNLTVSATGTLGFSFGGASDFTEAQVATVRAASGVAVGSAFGLDTTNATGGSIYSSAITGSGGFTKIGSNTLTLFNTSNSYTGPTTITGGTLTYAPGQLGTGAITFMPSGGSTGAIQPSHFITEDFSSRIQNSTGAITIDASSSAFTLTGIGSTNTAGLTKTGAGTLTLTGTNSYTGTTTVSAGTLNIISTTAIGTGTLALSGGTIDNTSGSALTLGNAITLGGNFGVGTALSTAANNFSFSSTTAQSFDFNGRTVTFNGTGQTLTFASSWNNSSSNSRTMAVNGAGNTLVIAGLSLDPSGTTTHTQTINGTGNVTVTGLVTNGGSSATQNLTYSGTGTLTLQGAANTYSGITTITSGILSVTKLDIGGNNSSIGKSTNAATNLVLGGGTLQYTGSGDTTDRSFNFSASSALDASGSGALTISGTPTNTGASGTLTLTLTGTNAAANTLTGIIANGATATSALTKNGSGAWTLTGVNTYTGATIVNAGTLTIASTAINTGTTAVTLNGGSLVLDLGIATTGVLATGDALTLAGGNLTVKGKAGVSVTQTTSAAFTFNAGLSSMTLNANGGTAASFTDTAGTYTRNAGGSFFLDLSAAGTGAFNSNLSASDLKGWAVVTDATGTGFGITTAGKVLVRATGATTLAGSSNSSATDFVTPTSGTITNTITTASLRSLEINTSGGIGSWDITSGKTATITNGGILMGPGSTNNFIISNGTLKSGTSTNSELFIHTMGTGTLMIGSVIANGNGTSIVTKDGTGTLILTGANTYTGATYINQGTIQFASASQPTGSGAVTINGGGIAQLGNANGLKSSTPITFGANSTGRFQLNGFNYTTGAISTNALLGTPIIENGSSTTNATLTNGVANTFAGTIQDGGTGTLAVTHTANTLTLSGANTYSGGTTITGGTVSANSNSALGTGAVTLNGGTLSSGAAIMLSNAVVANASTTSAINASNNLTLLGNLTGSGTISRNAGTQSLFLAGDNSGFTGTLNNTAGALRFYSASAGSASATWNFTSSSTANTFESTMSNGTIHFGALTGDGNISLNIGAANVTMVVGEKNNTTDTYTGVLGAGGIALVKAGTGTQVIGSANTYVGKTWVQNGTLSVSTLNSVNNGVPLLASSSLGAPLTASLATIGLGSSSTTGTLKVTGTGEATDRVIDLAGTTGGGVIDQSGTGTLKFTSNLIASGAGVKTLTLQGSTIGVGEINGTIVDNSAGNATSVTKAGTSTWTLSGNNTYTGATTVTAGRLVIDHSTGKLGQLGASAVTVNGAAVLSVLGSTSIGSDLTLAGGATLSAQGTLTLQDDAVNTLTVAGALNLGSASGGSILSFDLGSVNGSNDLLAITGSATVQGVSTINLNATTLVSGSYTLITAAGGLGSSAFTLGSKPAGFNTFSLANSTATAVILDVSANPAIVGAAYWTGLASADTELGGDALNQWGYGNTLTATKSNWSLNAAGTVDALQVPGATADVIFTAANVTAANIATTLDASYSIKSLTFDTSLSATPATAVTIDTNGNALTIGTGGLTLASTNPAAVTIGGTGSVVINGNQSWKNNSSSVLNISSAITGSASAGVTETVSVDGSGSGAINLGAISDGTGGGQLALTVNQSGSGIVTLTSATTHTGGTSVLAGTLAEGASGALSDVGTLTVNGSSAIFDLGANHSDTVGGVVLDGNGTINGSGTSALTVNATGTFAVKSGTVNTILAGTGAMNKTTTGIVTLNAANTYSGLTTISAGILKLGNASALGTTAGATSITSGGTLDLNGQTIAEPITVAGTGVGGNGAIINSSATAATITSTITNSGATVGGSGDMTFSGSVNSNTLTKIGTGKLTLSGAGDNNALALVVNGGELDLAKTGASSRATGSGSVQVNNGSLLKITGNGGDQIYQNVGVTLNDGTFDLNGFSESFDALAGSSPGVVTNTAASTTSIVTIGQNNGGSTFAGLLSNGASGTGILAITKIGSGTETFSGTANTYTGVTTISAGTLAVASLANGGVNSSIGASSNAATNLVFGGGTLQYNGGTTSTDRNFTINAATTATINVATSSTNLTMSGASTATTGALSKKGLGTLTLTGANQFTGNVAVNEGNLVITNSNALGTGTKTISIIPTSNPTSVPALRLDPGASGSITLPSTFSFTVSFDALSGSLPIANAGAVVNESGNNTIQGSFTLTSGGGGTTFLSNAGKLTLSGNITTNATSRALYLRGDGDGEISGSISNGSTLDLPLTKQNGNGTWKLSGTNTYTGVTTVSSGTLQFAKAVSLNAANWTDTKLVVESGATAAFNVGGSGEFSAANIQTLSALGTASGGFKNGSRIGLDTTNATGGVFVYGLALTDTNSGGNSVGLVKLGTNTLALTSSTGSTYTGGTTVSAGTLLADNTSGSATGAGSVTVASGATLGGTGTVGSASSTSSITVQSGGSLMIGDTHGAASGSGGAPANLSLATSGSGTISLLGGMKFDLFGNTLNGTNTLNPSSDADLLTLTSASTVQISGSLQVTDTTGGASTTWTLGSVWKLIDWAGVTNATPVSGGFASFDLPDFGSNAGLAWDTTHLLETTGALAGTISIVPEPSRTLLVLGGLALACLRRRR